ncbi:MAG: hypothetical protein ACYSUT_12070 [Planctomycetota bacterium]
MKSKITQNKQRRLGWVAGFFLGRHKGPKHTARQLYEQDFHSNTRKIGVRFSKRLRNTFRHRWLRLK